MARVESKTFISTATRREAIPIPKPGIKGQLGNWISPDDLQTAVNKRFFQSMKGRTLYLFAFWYLKLLNSVLKSLNVSFLFEKYGSYWIAAIQNGYPSDRFGLRGGLFAYYDTIGTECPSIHRRWRFRPLPTFSWVSVTT